MGATTLITVISFPGTFTPFDVTGSVSTFLLGLNDAGDFVGSFDSGGIRQGFSDIGGVVNAFRVNGAITTDANDINAAREIVGEYFDPPPATTFHGYFVDASGNVTFPINFPSSISTTLIALNDSPVAVGRYVDAGGVEHGLLFKLPHTFLSFDFPGATGTSLNGINNAGMIAGRYTDAAGIRHGFIARSR